MIRFFLDLFVLALFCLVVGCGIAKGQCPGGVCPVPSRSFAPSYYQSSYQSYGYSAPQFFAPPVASYYAEACYEVPVVQEFRSYYAPPMNYGFPQQGGGYGYGVQGYAGASYAVPQPRGRYIVRQRFR